MRRIRRHALHVALAAVAIAALPAAGDDVHLTNGRAFYGVVAEVQGDKVAIRLPDGLIRLPAHRVARIERAKTELEEYVERRRELTARRAPAAAWLDLAHWARDAGFNTAYRESARRAADLDPHVDGLKPLMRDLGWIWDADADRWLDESVAMQRRGLVRYGGSWVTPAERAAAMAQTAEAAARRADVERQARRDAAELALAARRLAAEQAAPQPAADAAAPVIAYGIGYWPPVVHVHPHRGAGHRPPPDGEGGDTPARAPRHADERTATQPTGDRHNQGGFRASDWIPGRLGNGAAPPPGRLGPTARGQ